MEERRQLPRWEINKEVKVWLPEARSFRYAYVKDIHLKGMCVASDKRLFQQQVVKMAFAIGESFDLIKVEAEIPWVREDDGRYFYGLSFTRIDDLEKDKIYQYYSTNCYDQLKHKWWEPGGKALEG